MVLNGLSVDFEFRKVLRQLIAAVAALEVDATVEYYGGTRLQAPYRHTGKEYCQSRPRIFPGEFLALAPIDVFGVGGERLKLRQPYGRVSSPMSQGLRLQLA